jgi:hypothetical protein
VNAIRDTVRKNRKAEFEEVDYLVDEQAGERWCDEARGGQEYGFHHGDGRVQDDAELR